MICFYAHKMHTKLFTIITLDVTKTVLGMNSCTRYPHNATEMYHLYLYKTFQW